jgi:gamma-glutamylcyclotransferase (GGCT)/AIG2-like uncharacterized protein YtfP
MKKNLFAYGSLMFPEVLHRLISPRHATLDATLKDHQRFRIIKETYPALIEQNGQQVEGLLIIGLTLKDLIALDRFEGKFYIRRTVTVSGSDSNTWQAETYLFRKQYRHRLTEQEWDANQFREKHLQEFLQTYP